MLRREFIKMLPLISFASSPFPRRHEIGPEKQSLEKLSYAEGVKLLIEAARESRETDHIQPKNLFIKPPGIGKGAWVTEKPIKGKTFTFDSLLTIAAPENRVDVHLCTVRKAKEAKKIGKPDTLKYPPETELDTKIDETEEKISEIADNNTDSQKQELSKLKRELAQLKQQKRIEEVTLLKKEAKNISWISFCPGLNAGFDLDNLDFMELVDTDPSKNEILAHVSASLMLPTANLITKIFCPKGIITLKIETGAPPWSDVAEFIKLTQEKFGAITGLGNKKLTSLVTELRTHGEAYPIELLKFLNLAKNNKSFTELREAIEEFEDELSISYEQANRTLAKISNRISGKIYALNRALENSHPEEEIANLVKEIYDQIGIQLDYTQIK